MRIGTKPRRAGAAPGIRGKCSASSVCSAVKMAGPAGDPATRLGLASGMIFLIGGMNILLGLLATAAQVHWLQRIGISP